jgi:hypothetical protein
VLLGLLPQGTPTAEQQQRLVARVGYRVSGLGQQRCGSREEERRELRRGDAQVRRERGSNRASPAAVRGGRLRPLSADPRSLLPVPRRRIAGLVNQEHGDAVANRVGQAAVGSGAHQLTGGRIGPQRRVAFRAGEDVEEPLIDLHWFSRKYVPRP